MSDLNLDELVQRMPWREADSADLQQLHTVIPRGNDGLTDQTDVRAVRRINNKGLGGIRLIPAYLP